MIYFAEWLHIFGLAIWDCCQTNRSITTEDFFIDFAVYVFSNIRSTFAVNTYIGDPNIAAQNYQCKSPNNSLRYHENKWTIKYSSWVMTNNKRVTCIAAITVGIRFLCDDFLLFSYGENFTTHHGSSDHVQPLFGDVHP